MYDVMMYTPVFMMLEAASAHVPDIPATEAGSPLPGTTAGPLEAASRGQWRPGIQPLPPVLTNGEAAEMTSSLPTGNHHYHQDEGKEYKIRYQN